MFYLKLSGFVPEDKELEFEQTYRFVSTLIPKSCNSYNISKDAINEGVYHFISYWSSLEVLETFARSAPFLILNGAFKTLGELYEKASGEMMQIEK